MKKLLLTATLLGSFVAADAQYWNPYFANLDTTWGIRYMDALDTSVVWAIGYDGTVPARTSNKFTRSIDGVNFVSGTFYSDTNTFAPSNISVVDANTAYIATYTKSGDGTPGQILKTVDGGLNWANVATANMYNSAANFPNIVHFFGMQIMGGLKAIQTIHLVRVMSLKFGKLLMQVPIGHVYQALIFQHH